MKAETMNFYVSGRKFFRLFFIGLFLRFNLTVSFGKVYLFFTIFYFLPSRARALYYYCRPFTPVSGILLLLGDSSGSCRVHDPAEGYKVVFTGANYDAAQIWLLEDEYEPIEGRLSISEL